MLTTIHDLNDGTLKNRKRPKKGNYAVSQVFGSSRHKLLTIPQMIDDFNSHMGRVDIADQLRSNYYTQLPTRRSWLLLLYWLLDTLLINSYILNRMYDSFLLHKMFILEVAEAL